METLMGVVNTCRVDVHQMGQGVTVVVHGRSRDGALATMGQGTCHGGAREGIREGCLRNGDNHMVQLRHAGKVEKKAGG